MTPTQAIAALDRALAASGEDAILTRNIGTNAAQVPVSVKVRVKTYGYKPQALYPGSPIQQGDMQVILSPTQINAAQWPGGIAAQPGALDPRIPIKSDRLIIGGHVYQVQAAADVSRIRGHIVRFELQVRG